MTTKHTPATPPWERWRYLGMLAYRRGPYTIQRRFRWSYLGGGRQGSRQLFYVYHDTDPGKWSGRPFYRVTDAKAFVTRALLRELGEL